MNEDLARALAAEEAAIYAYGIIGVHLSGTAQTLARSAEADHRARRDQLVSRLDELKASPAPAPAGYDLPFPVTDKETALKLAIQVEDGVAQAWRATLAATSGTDRAVSLAALSGAAIQAVRWRRAAGVAPLTMAFPGRPA
ncbi:ferritin-like domain-containing protein [Actinoplanes sp. NPDC049265]|uniref:ferritin-like domain-containing protein n=1 Tax=Actinoplanes sp. NPDC049265 TaxID=3363902 RepID=UPI00371A799A